MDLGVAVQAREHPGQHDAILERVTRSRRGLRVVAQHPEDARLVAGQIDGVREQLGVVGQPDAVTGP